MLVVWLFLPEEHDFDLEDPDSAAVVQGGLEARLHQPILLTIVKRRIPRPVTVVLGELHAAA